MPRCWHYCWFPAASPSLLLALATGATGAPPPAPPSPPPLFTVPVGAALPALKAPGKSDLWNFGRGLRGHLRQTRMPQLSLATRSAVHSSIAPAPGRLETQTHGVAITHRTSFHPAYARLRAMSEFLAPRAVVKGKHLPRWPRQPRGPPPHAHIQPTQV